MNVFCVNDCTYMMLYVLQYKSATQRSLIDYKKPANKKIAL